MESRPSAPPTGTGVPAPFAGGPDRDALRRPRRYWVMLGALLAVLGLIPLAGNLLPPVATFIAVPLLLMAIVITAAHQQPRAVRSLKLTGIMWVPYVGGVVLVAVLAGAGAALYSAHGGWAIPVATAAVLFTVCALGGRAMDDFWGRHVRKP
ncbi:hypothetical protein [Arthrobacter sp.]|uniref:hypothetical protein n=1 Tax=Arthrobacter sp. TaxID=1667 RepID=UPI003A8F8352